MTGHQALHLVGPGCQGAQIQGHRAAGRRQRLALINDAFRRVLAGHKIGAADGGLLDRIEISLQRVAMVAARRALSTDVAQCGADDHRFHDAHRLWWGLGFFAAANHQSSQQTDNSTDQDKGGRFHRFAPVVAPLSTPLSTMSRCLLR